MDQFIAKVLEYFKRVAEALEKIADKEPVQVIVNETPTQPQNPTPVVEYPDMPEFFVKPADIPQRSADWKSGELVYIPWGVGPHSQGNPSMIDFRDNGSAILEARDVSGKWNTGAFQWNFPTYAKGRWGWVITVPKSNAVAAMFVYDSKSSKEVDYELVESKDENGQEWALTLHMPQADGTGRVSVSGGHVPVTNEDLEQPHLYEFEINDDATVWYIDGKEVGRVTKEQIEAKGGVYNLDRKVEAFTSIEWHERWAEWDAADYKLGGEMVVYGMALPGHYDGTKT